MKRLFKWLLFAVMLCCLSAAFVACGEKTEEKQKQASFELVLMEFTNYAKYKEYKDVRNEKYLDYVHARTYTFYKDGPNLKANADKYFFNINGGWGALDHDMTSDGFTFLGVYSEPEGKGDMYIDKTGLIVKDITCEGDSLQLYLYTLPTNYTARLHGVDGEEDTFFEYNYWTDKKALPKLRKENYEFFGWCQYTNDQCNHSECAITEITYGTWGVEEYYPVFKGVENKVMLDPLNGDITDNFVIDNECILRYNEKYFLPVPIAPAGYGFAGWWYNEGDCYITDKTGKAFAPFTFLKDITVKAVYKQKSVVWVKTSVENDEKQELLDDLLLDEEIELVAPSIIGYRCVGLQTPTGQMLTEAGSYKYTVSGTNVSLLWRYEPLQTVIIVNLTDVYVNGEMPQSFAYGQNYALPMAYKKGYAFQGWQTESEKKLLTDKEGNSTQNWNSLAEYVIIEPLFVADAKAPSPVYDAESLLSVKDNASGVYILFKNIDMTGISWEPFAFSGTLDGNGMVVSGITAASKTGDLGMFTSLTGTVKDLTLNGVNIESDSGAKVNVGGLCGSLNGTVENVTVYGTVKGDHANIGGIVGAMSGGKVTGSVNYAAVSTITLESGATAGGVVGSASAGSIEDCENYGNVSGFSMVGGVLGYSNNMLTLTNSKNGGIVTGESMYVGGVLGRIQTVSTHGPAIQVNNLENVGAVTGGKYTGGVIGLWDSNLDWSSDETYYVDIYKLTNSGEVKGADYVGGCAGYIKVFAANAWGRNPTMQLKLTDLINTGNVTGLTVVGGCIGYTSGQRSSKLIRSSSSATVTAEHTVGGIAGSMDGVCLDSCTNTGTTVTATGYYISNSSNYVRLGGLVGAAADVVNCRNEANITYNNKGGYIGGIAGYATKGISKCVNDGDVNAPSANFVGGIAGYVENKSIYNMSELTNNGKISGAECVGGIFGAYSCEFGVNDSNVYTSTLSKFTNTGAIVSNGGFSAGVIGRITTEGIAQYGHNASVKVVLTNIENSGAVTTGTTLSVGGIVGSASTDSTGSILDGYTCTGTLNGAAVDTTTLVGSATNFRVVEQAEAVE